MMRRLDNAVRHYAWGSRTHIPRLCGLDISDEPSAELWMGAHPADPSRLPDGRPLDAAIEQDPHTMVGAAVTDAFGPRLPYLLKLLAAAEPLSLQVHPTSERARIRFAEQNASGIAMTAPERSYQDPSHKPELVYALTRFEGMAGFRETGKTAQILRGLSLPWLDEIADRLDGTYTPFQTLREVVTELLAMHGSAVTDRLRDLRDAAVRAEVSAHRPPTRQRPPLLGADDVARESIRVYAALVPLVERYPHDPGVLVTLLLNHVVLPVGGAMFIDAGVIHAYTSGFGVEIMASSDNVVRAGLTPKYVDIPELLQIANFTPMPPPLWSGRKTADGAALHFTPPVEEFELAIHELAGDRYVLAASTPRIVLCLDGAVDLAAESDKLSLVRGESTFVDASTGALTVSGHGRLAVATTPTTVLAG